MQDINETQLLGSISNINFVPNPNGGRLIVTVTTKERLNDKDVSTPIPVSFIKTSAEYLKREAEVGDSIFVRARLVPGPGGIEVRSTFFRLFPLIELEDGKLVAGAAK